MSQPRSSAKDAILARVRAALRAAPDAAPIPRDYRHADDAPHAAQLAAFCERVADYNAQIAVVSAADLPGAIAADLAAQGVRTLAVPADLPDEWLPAGIDLRRDSDPPLTNAELDGCDGVLTACAAGIAQTGTIVLDGGPGQGRRALSLVPDFHLCVIQAAQVVGLVPEAITRLQPSRTRPLTFISGPSATSDIELSRVEGVHGPRTLHVLVVAE